MPNVSDMMAYENGTMDREQMVDFFQGLIDSGIVWSLQGSYGRTAAQLIDSGYCEDTRHTRS
jgi:hypothetical protein